MRVRHLLTSVAAVKERRQFSTRFPRPRWFVRLSCSDLVMLRLLPVFPMFGSGATRLQPVYVEDVAEAVVRILRAPAASQPYELAGPCVYTYQELLRTIAASAGTRPLLVPF